MYSNSFINCAKRCVTWISHTRHYATKDVTPGISSLGKTKKLGGKAGQGTTQKVILPVETDAHRLVNYVCGTNLLKEGGEDIAIKPDSEYPDWLWTIKYDGPPKLSEQDPNTFEYWLTARKLAKRRKNQLVSRQRVKP